MIDFAICAAWVLLYFAVGMFLDTLLSETEPSLVMMLLWPLGILLGVILLVCVYIPGELAKKIRNKFKK